MVRIILFIILVILIIIIISSIGYKDLSTPEVKGKNQDEQKKESLVSAHPEFINGCFVYDIQDLDFKDAYIFSGKFNNSTLSIYKDGSKIYSDIINGDKSCIISSNQVIISSVARFIKNKSNLIGLPGSQKYRIVVDNVNNFDIKHYFVNYTIENKVINFDNKNIGLNEYDIFTNLSKTYPTINRKFLKTTSKENKWSMKDTGKYIIAIVDNLNNLTVTINDINHDTHYNGSLKPEIKLVEVENPNIIVFNKDYKTKIKDINQEYLDFINGPNYLVLKFLHGSDKKEIDYTSQVNNKVFIYKIEDEEILKKV